MIFELYVKSPDVPEQKRFRGSTLKKSKKLVSLLFAAKEKGCLKKDFDIIDSIPFQKSGEVIVSDNAGIDDALSLTSAFLEVGLEVRMKPISGTGKP